MGLRGFLIEISGQANIKSLRRFNVVLQLKLRGTTYFMNE